MNDFLCLKKKKTLMVRVSTDLSRNVYTKVDQWTKVNNLLWPRKGSLMKTQTWILDNRLYYTRKTELHRKGKKSHTVCVTPIVICPSGCEISVLITVRRVHYSKMGKVPTTQLKFTKVSELFLKIQKKNTGWPKKKTFFITSKNIKQNNSNYFPWETNTKYCIVLENECMKLVKSLWINIYTHQTVIVTWQKLPPSQQCFEYTDCIRCSEVRLSQ